MEESQLKKRVICDVILFCLVFLLPWWVSLILGLIFALSFENYYELLFLGIFIDSLYTTPLAFYHHFQFVISLFCAIVLLILVPLRKQLRF